MSPLLKGVFVVVVAAAAVGVYGAPVTAGIQDQQLVEDDAFNANVIECSLCKDVVEHAESKLTSAEELEALTAWGERLCTRAPLNLTNECDLFVSEHAAAIIQTLVAHADPQATCSLMRACPKPSIGGINDDEGATAAGSEPAAVAELKCTLCQEAVTKAESAIDSPEAIAAVAGWVEKLCADVPAGLEAECRAVVDEFVGAVVDALVEKMPPATVCSRVLDACPATAVSSPLMDAFEATEDDRAAYADLPDLPDEVARVAPTMASLFRMAREDPAALADHLARSEVAAIARPMSFPPPVAAAASAEQDNGALPVVMAHGMGDSCFNSGFKSVVEATAQHLNTYAVCIPTGKTRVTDTINGFLMSMDASVEEFAKRVRADPKLANGFNAYGLSQGNNLIRGYIAKYNDPPVHTFMSICGINAGVGAFPQCSPSIPVVGKVCQGLAEVLGKFAYMKFFQDHLFQADYYRDPVLLNASAYLENSELAKWNGESGDASAEKANWAKTSQYVWVKGTKDTVVWPREGEWWGAADPQDPWKKTVDMKQTRWYTEDLFGLRTADEAGKNAFESFDGQHIQMTEAQLMSWLDKYFK